MAERAVKWTVSQVSKTRKHIKRNRDPGSTAAPTLPILIAPESRHLKGKENRTKTRS